MIAAGGALRQSRQGESDATGMIRSIGLFVTYEKKLGQNMTEPLI